MFKFYLILIAMMITSCASIHGGVESFTSDEDIASYKYAVVPANRNLIGDLEFEKYKKMVVKSLIRPLKNSV